MARYDIRLCTDKGVRIHDKGVNDHGKGAKYDPERIPGMLACVVMDYLKNSPIPGRHEGPRHGRQTLHRIPAPFGE